MREVPFRDLYLPFGVAVITLTAILTFDVLLKPFKKQLNPNLSQAELWQRYRWSIDPSQRREAALLLVSKSKGSFSRHKRLLIGQGWGTDPMAAIAIKLQAQTFEKLGNPIKAKKSWENLLMKFQ